MSVRKFILTFVVMTAVLMALSAGVLYYAFVYRAGGSLPGSDGEGQEKTGRVNMLILGTDVNGLNSDSIMLASLEREQKTLDVMSIPRDTRVQIKGKNYKINAAHLMGGEELSVQTVKDLLGVPIHYYVAFDTAAFREIIDALDGVYLDVPTKMDYEDPAQGLYIHLKPGYQLLDGDKAEQFVRYRKYVQGDLERVSAQQMFVKALMEQKLTLKYINHIDDIFKVVEKRVKTNVQMGDIIKHMFVIKNLSAENIRMHQMPGTTQNINGLSYVICDKKETNQMLVDYFGATIEGYTPKPSPSPSVSPSPDEE